MPKILIVSGHPDPAGSLANKLILNNVRELLSDAAVRELGALYPDGNFDVTAEQEALASADIIVPGSGCTALPTDPRETSSGEREWCFP